MGCFVDIVDNLIRIGLSAYEAKCYVALLSVGGGNGYAIAKAAGIPTAKVYGALASLEAKGFAEADGMKRARYAPIPPERALGPIKNDFTTAIDRLTPALSALAAAAKTLDVRNISGVEMVYAEIEKLILNATDKLLATAWPVDLERARQAFSQRTREVRVTILSYGPFALPDAEIFAHRRSDLVKAFLRDRWFLIVSPTEGIAACFNDNGGARAIWSADPGVFRIFADHILHDISLNRVIASLPPKRRDRVEAELTALRDRLAI